MSLLVWGIGMKIGVLGSGEVAKVLASGFLKHGHEVTLGSRTADKLAGWATQNPTGKTGTFADAAAFGDLVVLVVKGTAALDALRLAGAENLKEKPVIDACNPIADAPPVNGVLRFFTTHDESLMEQLQREFAAANFVKAFNSVGSNFMVNPQFPGGKPTMFICGNNKGAKKAVDEILDQFGWETADMGGAESARAIEPLCMLWCIPGFLRNEWTHAFKLLKK
jgi:predicted dinucleotide-binding enzyme